MTASIRCWTPPAGRPHSPDASPCRASRWRSTIAKPCVRRVDGQRAPTKLLEAADVGGGAEVEDRRALDLPDDDEVVALGVPWIRLSIAVRPRSHEPSMSFARCSVDERVRTVSISRAASSR